MNFKPSFSWWCVLPYEDHTDSSVTVPFGDLLLIFETCFIKYFCFRKTSVTPCWFVRLCLPLRCKYFLVTPKTKKKCRKSDFRPESLSNLVVCTISPFRIFSFSVFPPPSGYVRHIFKMPLETDLGLGTYMYDV